MISGEQTLVKKIKRNPGATYFHGNLNVTDADGNVQILEGKVTASGLTAYIGPGSISGIHIQDGAITTVKIALDAVDATVIAAGAVEGVHIADDAITSPKIIAGAIVAGLLATDSVISSNIITGAITTNKIEAGAIDTDRLAANSITSPKIAANEIKTINIEAGAITTVKLAALSITAEKIATNAITADKIIAGAITADKIGSGTINSKTITLSASDSDCYIASGKTDFNDTTPGWIIGRDYSDSNRAKISIGNANNFLRWTGTILEMKGVFHIVGGIGISNFSDAGGLALRDFVDMSTGEIINKTADNIEESTDKKWAGESGANITGDHTSANTNKVQDYTIISGGKIITELLTADNIITGTMSADRISGGSITGIIITGGTFQTSTDLYPRVKITTSGITINGQYLYLSSSSGARTGYLYGTGTKLALVTYSSGDYLWFGSHSYIVLDAAAYQSVRPNRTTVSLGTASYYWSNFYTNNSYVTSRRWRNATSRYIHWHSIHSQVEMNSGLYVGGRLSKATGSFIIDHPLKPHTHTLQHSFVESPEMLNIYRGNAWIKDGKCKIKMPNWFIALNGNNKDDYSYNLTSIGKYNTMWVEKEMNDNGEVIFAAEKDGKFSYIIYAVRHDPYAENHRIKIEEKKDKKYYLYPEYYKFKK